MGAFINDISFRDACFGRAIKKIHTHFEVSVDLLDSTTETGVSERDVVDEGVGPVLLGGVVHDLLKSRIDDVDLTRARKLSHVRRVLRDNVTHHLEELLVLLLLVSLVDTAGSNVIQVLEPLEVRAGDTTPVGQHVGDNNNSLGVKNFSSHESSGTIGTFEDDFALELVGVVLVDSLLLGSGDEDVTRHLHEALGVHSLDLVGVAVVGESALGEHLGSNIIDVKTRLVVNGGVILNDTNDNTSIFREELSSPVANCAEALDNERLSRDSLGSEFGSLDERVGLQELSDAVVDSESGTLSASANTTLVDEFTSAASFGVDVLLSLHLDVGVLDPGHDLLVGAHVGSEAVNTRSNKALLGELHGVSAGDLLKFVLRVEFGVNRNTSFGSSERHISNA